MSMWLSCKKASMKHILKMVVAAWGDGKSFLRRRRQMSSLNIRRVHLFHIFESLDETLLIHGTGLTPRCNKKYLHKKLQLMFLLLHETILFQSRAANYLNHSTFITSFAGRNNQLQFTPNLKIYTKPQVPAISFVNIVFVTHQRSTFYSFFHTLEHTLSIHVPIFF